MADNTSMIAGLFSSPEQYQLQQNQLAQQNAMTMAQLTPEQQVTAQMIRAGGTIGGGIGRLMGAEDPQLKLIAARNSLAKQFDTSTSEGLTKLANALREIGDQQGAAQIGASAFAARQKENETMAKMREHLSTEQKNAAGLADSEFNRGTPEWNRKYSQELTRLTTAAKSGANIKEIGVAEGTREPVYFDTSTDTQFVMKSDSTGKQTRVPFSGGVDRTTAKTNVSVDAKGEAAFVQELGKLDARAVSEAMTSRNNAIKELDTLKKMSEVAQRPIIQGTGAEQRADVANFFSTIGLSSNADKIKTSNSQEYIKYSTGLVLDSLKKTGYNPSNRDLEVVKSIIPRLETDPTARKELISYMAARANDVVNETTRMEQYAREKKGLSGYKPTVPLLSFATKPSGQYSDLSDAELNARIKAAQAASNKGQ